MMPRLLLKELRQLMPLVVVFLALEGVGVVQHFLFEAPEEAGWAQMSMLLRADVASFSAGVSLIFAFVAAYMQLPREFEQRTIEMLFSLPVRRRTVFLTKFLAVCLLGVGFAVFDGLLSAWLQSFATDSFAREQYRPGLAVLEVFLAIGYHVICGAYGMLLSFWRRLALPIAFGVWSVLEVVEQVWPASAPLNVMNLLQTEHVGVDPVIPWGAWLLHAVGGTVALGAAGVLWLGHRQWMERQGLLPARWHGIANILYWVSLVGAGVMAIGVVVFLAGRAGDSEEDGRTLQTMETERFIFTYPVEARESALLVMRRADAAYVEIAARLGAGPHPGKVVADLSEEDAAHAGIAGWQKMRMDVSEGEQSWLLHVLHHEVTHVVAAVASKRELAHHGSETLFFNEGLAEYTAYALGPTEDTDASWRRLAATAVTRLGITFDDLVQHASFVARYDANLMYPIGHSWVEALVTACGEDAPRRVLATMAAGGIPQRLAPRAYWEQVMLRAKCSLETTNSRWLSGLRREAQRALPFPEPVGTFLGSQDDKLRFEVDLDNVRGSPTTLQVIVRVRDHEGSSLAQIAGAFGQWKGGPVVLEVSANAVSGDQLQYQVGVIPAWGGRPYYGRWQKAGG